MNVYIHIYAKYAHVQLFALTCTQVPVSGSINTLSIQLDTIDLVIPRSAIPGNRWQFTLMAHTTGGEDRMPDPFSAGYSDGTFSATFDSLARMSAHRIQYSQ